MPTSDSNDMSAAFPLRVFISCAAEEKAFLIALEKHLSGLKSAGLISTWSFLNVKPGENVERTQREQADQATIFVVLLSADFLADDSLASELKNILTRANKGEVRLIPIRVRPVNLADTPIDKMQTLPDGDAVSLWDDQDAAWESIANRLATMVNSYRVIRPPPPKLSSQEEAQLARLHAKVERFWIAGVLRSPPEAPMMLSQRRTIEEEWLAGIATELEPAAPIEIPSDRPIQTIFEESKQSLLLLGQPGMGKTTQLLLLAQALLNASPQPVPVIFTLATWRESARSLSAWMAEELRIQYQVPGSFAEKWVKNGIILPLLNGLDEVPERLRQKCVDAINESIDALTLPGIAVTCGQNEYESLRSRLRLNTALRLHPLTREVVADVFSHHSSLAKLPTEQQEQLIALAERPVALTLLLHVASDTLSPASLDALLDAYVERMSARSGKKKLPVSREKFIAILEQLAFAMQRNKCAVFQLDFLQPGWLEKPQSVWAYAFASRLIGAGVCGASVISSYGLTPLENLGFKSTLRVGVELALCTMLSAGIITSLAAGRALTSPLQKRRSGRAHIVYVGTLALAAGAIDAAVLGLWEHHLIPAIMGFQIGLLATILVCPHPGVGDRYADIYPRETLRFSWRHALRTSPVGIALALIAFLSATWVREFAPGILIAAILFAAAFLFGGLRGTEVDEKAAQYHRIRRSLRLAWIVSIAGGIAFTAIMGFFYGLVYGLYAGLTALGVMWLWYGGYAIIQHSILKALLSREKHAYCNDHILDAGIERDLLYRVGGGCMFVHSLIVSRLADRHGSRQNAA